jgi:hypothetical protein
MKNSIRELFPKRSSMCVRRSARVSWSESGFFTDRISRVIYRCFSVQIRYRSMSAAKNAACRSKQLPRWELRSMRRFRMTCTFLVVADVMRRLRELRHTALLEFGALLHVALERYRFRSAEIQRWRSVTSTLAQRRRDRIVSGRRFQGVCSTSSLHKWSISLWRWRNS